ncbi:hypothetical protein [Rhodopirellula islandica]|uniref:hypothetical protein n=1 Tax=Rhodopirellula islandica TaxID=595434 RepID=UPI00156A0316|nr:hypothetical protein [Rhodopirellula islandica]
MTKHYGALLLAGAAVAVIGCDGTSSKTAAKSTTFVTLAYDGTPLANVQVRLKQSADGITLDQSVTNEHGVAHFHALPSPEPESYVVAMESISDGGWMLKASVVDKFCDSLRLKPFSETPQQTIELPRRAVHSLSSIH